MQVLAFGSKMTKYVINTLDESMWAEKLFDGAGKLSDWKTPYKEIRGER